MEDEEWSSATIRLSPLLSPPPVCACDARAMTERDVDGRCPCDGSLVVGRARGVADIVVRAERLRGARGTFDFALLRCRCGHAVGAPGERSMCVIMCVTVTPLTAADLAELM